MFWQLTMAWEKNVTHTVEYRVSAEVVFIGIVPVSSLSKSPHPALTSEHYMFVYPGFRKGGKCTQNGYGVMG